MARAPPVAAALSCLVGAWAARGTAREGLELPWRKGLLVGSVLGRAASSSAVLARGEAQVGDFGEAAVDEKVDALGLEGLIAAFLESGPDSADEASLKMLLQDLRRRGNMDGELAAGLLSSFEDAWMDWTLERGGDHMVDVIMLPYFDGSQVVQIGRFRARDHRSPGYARMLGSMLWGSQRADELDGLFLRSVARSHTEEELAEDPDAEILMIFEPQISLLNDFVVEVQPDFGLSLSLFINAYTLVHKLCTRKIPHDSSLISAETFAVTGDLDDPRSLKLVLMPLILDKGQALERMPSFLEGSRQLGGVLRFLFDRAWPPEAKPKVDALMAFGKAMESGAFLHHDGAVGTRELFDAVVGDTSPERLRGLRMEYLKLALVTQRAKSAKSSSP